MLPLVGTDADKVVLSQGVVDPAEGHLDQLPGHPEFQLRLRTAQGCQQIVQQLSDPGIVIGLAQIVERVQRQRIPDVLLRRGYEDDRDPGILAPEVPGGLDAVQSRHADVQKDHILLREGAPAQEFAPAGVQRALQAAAVGGRSQQRALQDLGVRPEILDDGAAKAHGDPFLPTIG